MYYIVLSNLFVRRIKKRRPSASKINLTNFGKRKNNTKRKILVPPTLSLSLFQNAKAYILVTSPYRLYILRKKHHIYAYYCSQHCISFRGKKMRRCRGKDTSYYVFPSNCLLQYFSIWSEVTPLWFFSSTLLKRSLSILHLAPNPESNGSRGMHLQHTHTRTEYWDFDIFTHSVCWEFDSFTHSMCVLGFWCFLHLLNIEYGIWVCAGRGVAIGAAATECEGWAGEESWS